MKIMNINFKFTEKAGNRPAIDPDIENLPRVPSDYHDLLREMAKAEKAAKGITEPEEASRRDPTLGDSLDLDNIDLTALVDHLPINTRLEQRYRIRYRIKMMENNQYKVVAGMDLPSNSIIISETPVFYTSANDMEGFNQVLARVWMLPFPEKEAVARMRSAQDFSRRFITYQSRLSIKKIKQMIANKSFKLPKHLDYVDMKDEHSRVKNLVLKQYITNRFKISDDAACIDVHEPLYGIYQDAARINHSADPNCVIDINEAPPFKLFLIATKDVKKDEELTVSYHDDMHCGPIRYGEKAAKCKKLFGYSCFCKVCNPPVCDFPEDEEEDFNDVEDDSSCAIM